MRLSRPRFGQWAILIAALCVALVAAQSDWLRSMENDQRAVVAQFAQQDASQQIHIVEVDAKSIAQVRQWPWSREHHARLVQQLSDAGARSIVFDIDFASYSSPSADGAFADAIASSKAAVVLPTFSQASSEQADSRIDALPIPELRENSSLASASVRPDSDALVRRMVYGTVTDGLPRPSMASHIAGVSGAADANFLIDYSIAPASIPRHSFVDIENGDFDASQVAGKDVLVGATAIELGDRYGVPTYGVIPGVTIQALAAETLLIGAHEEWGWLPVMLVGLVLAFIVSTMRTYFRVAAAAALSLVILIALQAFGYHTARIVMGTLPAMAMVAAVAVGQIMRLARVQLRQRSLQDAETGLPNALAFARAKHGEDQLVATAYIQDFDSIQSVIGSSEIRKFFDRLEERIEAVIGIPTLYRADTRMLAWAHEGEYQTLIDGFSELAQSLRKPIEIAGKRVDIAVAFGIASGVDLPAASRAASVAAKEGKLWHAHEDAEAAMVEARVSLMGELDDAIVEGQLDVVYQPKLRLSSGKIESVEALVRWNHPERGFMRPDLFIPLAEETNRIEPLTLFVLKRAIEDLNRWCEEGIVISAAVNISANLVSSEAFANAVEQILLSSNVPRDQLIFEVTESAAMRDADQAVANLKRFRELGVRISMDDYGTGQSTLSYLQLLPLTELKIDRAFVQNAHIERSDAMLVRSTIQLAHSLDLQVVGEGVEDAECLEFLREAGCDYAQGYFISKPISADAIARQENVDRVDASEREASASDV